MFVRVFFLVGIAVLHRLAVSFNGMENEKARVTIGARLGYDVSFMRESTLLGLTRDLGVAIDAKVKATLGVTASGSYLVMVGREHADTASKTVRLRLHKQSKNGLDFALNLNVGVGGTVPFPDTFDDFVETVFVVSRATFSPRLLFGPVLCSMTCRSFTTCRPLTPVSNVQARCSLPALAGVICFSGENREPPASWS